MEILKVENLKFSYPRQEKDSAPVKPALEQVSFSIEEGDFVVVCGESGCGKTTLLRLLKRELAPTGQRSGEIYFCGKKQTELTDREAACEIGYVLQNPENQIVTDKVWHELAFGLENMGYPSAVIRRRVAEMACFFGIDDWFRKETSQLSGGQKQLLNLASIMVMQPKLLILDEPTSQLDPIAATEFIQTLVKLNKELGLTILMTEHRLEDVFPVADKIAVMEQGKMLFVKSPRETGKELKRLNANHKMLLGLPSAVRIYQGLDVETAECPLNVREGRYFLERSFDHQVSRIEKEAEDLSDRPIAMRMKDICFRYEKDTPDVLEMVELSIRQGEIISILGGNGVGKTTLLSVISGANKPYRGKIEILGKRLQKYKGKELYLHALASLPQNPQTVFIKMTVWEDYQEICQVMGYTKDQGKKEIEEMAELLGISHLMERHPYDLSGGEQQKAALGKVLLLKPRFLLLDEPTKGIDAYSKQQLGHILRKLKQQNIAILMVTHDVEFAAELSDKCGLFFDHSIISVDSPEEFFCNNNYYTTAANRISRHQFENAITCEDVITLCRKNRRIGVWQIGAQQSVSVSLGL